jgi:hypothetical protein
MTLTPTACPDVLIEALLASLGVPAAASQHLGRRVQF